MYCIKKYKKKKRFGYIYWIIIAILIMLIFINAFSNVLKSDDIDESSNYIEKAVNDVVGISSNNGQNASWGSGVIISKKGYILTNEHLVHNSQECLVFLNSNKKIKADTVWFNSNIDLAIIKVDMDFSSCAILTDQTELKLGQGVFAIGNPINADFSRSVTKGVISGLNRNLEFVENDETFYLNNLIQTDAGINLGNSGGALINEAGQVIGINTIKITSAESMGFAVPTDVIIPIIKKLENDGKFIEPTLGFSGYDKYSIDKLNLGIKLDRGIYIGEVNVDSSMEKSGVRVGDIILGADGFAFNKVLEFRKYIYEKNIGDIVNLKIKRDITEHNVTVVLE